MAIERLKKGELTRGKHLYFLGASGVMYVTWMLSTVVGMILGSAVPDVEKLGLDFPMTRCSSRCSRPGLRIGV